MKKLILLILVSVAVWGDGYFYNSFYKNYWDNFYETDGMTNSEVKEWGKQTIQDIVKECLNGNIESCNKYSNIYAFRGLTNSLLTVKSNLELPYNMLGYVERDFRANVVIPVINCKDYMKVIRKGCNLGSGHCCASLGDEFHPISVWNSDYEKWKPKYGLNCSLRNQNEAFKYYKKSCDLGESYGCKQYTELQDDLDDIDRRERDKTNKSDITVRQK